MPAHKILVRNQYAQREGSGSMVELLTRYQGAAGSSHTGVLEQEH